MAKQSARNMESYASVRLGHWVTFATRPARANVPAEGRTRPQHRFALAIALFALAPSLWAGPTEDWAAVMAATNRGDYATANRLLQSLAEGGDADAQYDLAVLYQTG